ncbi:hypothetical protein WJX73_002709 [Symbiochloris irregularis]|uniref:N-acetyltransferase domain-containing protein n=1 Tax=Symbiochloris irregularis TaxID=706552 RepID=A0AAW1NYS3_9CHLO
MDVESQTASVSSARKMLRLARELCRSTELQSATQLTVAMLFIALFTVVTAMRFTDSCLAVIWGSLMLLLASANGSVGARTFASVAPLTGIITGAITAGALISLSRAGSGDHRTVLQSVFGLLFMVVAGVCRSSKDLPTFGTGLMLHLSFGLVYLTAFDTWPATALWKQVGQNILAVMVGAGATFFVGNAVLPTSTARMCRQLMAKLCLNCSLSLDSMMPGSERPAEMGRTSQEAPLLLADADEERYRDTLKSQQADAAVHLTDLPAGTSLAAFSSMLASIKGLIVMAQFEMPLHTGTHQSPRVWMPVAASLEAVHQAIAMLESVKQQGPQIFESPHMKHAFKSDLGSVIRRLHKHVIARLQALAQGLFHHQSPSSSDWAAQRDELLAAAEAASQGYWGKYASDADHQNDDQPTALSQAAAVMFVVTVTTNILAAMDRLEGAVIHALDSDPPLGKATIVWVVTLFIALSVQGVRARFRDILGTQLRKAVTSWAGLMHVLQDTDFQFSVKQWIIAAGAIVLVINLNAHYHEVIGWSLYAGFIAACLIHYKALEVTVASAITRTVGALVGATLGYVCLLRPDLADKPVPLLVVVATANFILGWYNWYRWRMGIFYAVLNLNLVVLCQYTGHDDHTGTLKYWAARTSNVAGGGLIAVLVSVVILPYSSVKAGLGGIRAVLLASADSLQANQDAFFQSEASHAGVLPPGAAPRAQPDSVVPQSAAAAAQLSSSLSPATGLLGERTVWGTGPLSPPSGLGKLLQAGLLLRVCLAAFELVCNQPDELSYEAAEPTSKLYYHEILECLQQALTDVSSEICQAIQTGLQSKECNGSVSMDHLVELRVELRKSMHARRAGFMRLLQAGTQTAAQSPHADQMRDEVQVLDLGVSERARRKGVATSLAVYLANELRQDFASVVLEVAANNTAARRLYEKLGFKETGRRKGYYQTFDTAVDAVLMQCSPEEVGCCQDALVADNTRSSRCAGTMPGEHG